MTGDKPVPQELCLPNVRIQFLTAMRTRILSLKEFSHLRNILVRIHLPLGLLPSTHPDLPHLNRWDEQIPSLPN